MMMQQQQQAKPAPPQQKNLVSSYLKGIDKKRSGGATKMLGTSRNPNLVAPAATKKGLAVSSSLGASIEEIGVNLNRTLGGPPSRYF
jgi:hypothetical protein